MVVILVDSDRQSKFLSESVSQSVSKYVVRLPYLELLLCETELELTIITLQFLCGRVLGTTLVEV